MSRLEGSPTEIAEVLQNLEQTITCIESIQDRLTASQLTTLSLDKGRTPLEILAHIRSCAGVWSYSIYAMLAAKEVPTLAQINPHRWSAVLGYAKPDFPSSFHTYKTNRQEFLAVLRALPDDGWQKQATISERAHSVYSQARRMALHEVSHCKELNSLAEHASSR